LGTVTHVTEQRTFTLDEVVALVRGNLLLLAALATAADKAIARHRWTAGAFAVLCGLSTIVQGLAVIALYAPIFRMGAVV